MARFAPLSRRAEPRRASVVGAGSFGTAVAILLERAGLRTTLLCRTPEQVERILAAGENEHYLPGFPLPEAVKVRALGNRDDQFHRADMVFLAVPSSGLAGALSEVVRQGVTRRADVISLAKGLVPPDGTPPTVALVRQFGSERVACVGGPSHAREMVEYGAGLVAASQSVRLADRLVSVFRNAGLVCEASADPVGVELAGCAKNAAALAAGATEAQGLNAAGMAAADIFTEVLALAAREGGEAATFVGRAGTGDLVATALAPRSRNRSAGELLAQGIPAEEIPVRLGQACEALETVPLLARAAGRDGVSSPTLSALSRLIDGSLPLDDWVALVRVRQPEPTRPAGRLGAWFDRFRHRLASVIRGKPGRRPRRAALPRRAAEPVVGPGAAGPQAGSVSE
ncbi:MAG: glycerol-3-phosphate dehydrogenase [Thermoleophilaceae bacterium]|jgi:glycerol-3-phosphate dehydrogenase (NAD(P)+)|nr:glycerol-3-phosphate dehydrogenase [Thermoleophilaceae bacterium]